MLTQIFFMIFQQLHTGEHFSFSGITTPYIYRKINADYYSQNGVLKRIRPQTRIRRLDSEEVNEYLKQKQNSFENDY